MPTPQELGLVYDPYTGWRNPNAAQSVNRGDAGVLEAYTGGGQGGQDGQSMWSPSYQGDLQYLYRPTQEGHNAVGDYQDMYSKDGKYLSSGVIPKDDTLTQFLIAGGMLGGGVGATMMGLGGAGAAAGGASGGPGSASWGMGLDSVTGGSGALEAMGGASGAAGGSLGANGAFLGEGVASGVPAWDAAATGAGLSLSGAGSGLLNGALKYAPGLLGAIAGGKSGAGNGAGGAREMDPRLLPYIYGDENNKGGFGYATGLLNNPVAPNGFERFYGKK